MRNILKVAQIHTLCNWMDRKSLRVPTVLPSKAIVDDCMLLNFGQLTSCRSNPFLSLALCTHLVTVGLSLYCKIFTTNLPSVFVMSHYYYSKGTPSSLNTSQNWSLNPNSQTRKNISKDCKLLSFSEILAFIYTKSRIFGVFLPLWLLFWPFSTIFGTFWEALPDYQCLAKKNFSSDLMLYIKFQF